MKKIELLDCTLRDGAYIVDSMFGEQTIKGIISNLQKARVDIIECGWLKDDLHKMGTSFFHLPEDIKTYLPAHKRKGTTYIAMIDYNRYDCSILPECDGKTIDAIRIVFPRGKVSEAVDVGKKIRNKGYRVYFQAANTIGYADEELLEMIEILNEVKPEAVSIVYTFGKM